MSDTKSIEPTTEDVEKKTKSSDQDVGEIHEEVSGEHKEHEDSTV